MIDFNVAGGQSKNEARIATMKSYDACRACLMTPADKKAFPPPFSLKSGKYHGNQFVSLGGGANAPPWTVEMASIGKEEIEKVKLAGFRGNKVKLHNISFCCKPGHSGLIRFGLQQFCQFRFGLSSCASFFRILSRHASC